MWPFTKSTPKQESINGDYDLDDLLDMSDFSMETTVTEDDREPAHQFAAGAIKGVKTGLMKTTELEHVMKNILPTEFGQTYDATTAGAAKVRDIFADAVKEVKPGLAAIRSNTLNLIPEDKREALPRPIAALVAKLQDSQDQADNRATAYNSQAEAISPEQQREAMLGKTMADIFQSQA